MSNLGMQRIAELLWKRNGIDAEIAGIIGRPMTSGHLGEWIAAQVFDLELESNAAAAAIDGRFASGPLQGRTVNVKWYLKRDGVLDVTVASSPDFYLVLTGPAPRPTPQDRRTRPWCIEGVYLFDAERLLAELAARGVKIGVASSVAAAQWAAAEIYPRNNPVLPLTAEQKGLLGLLSPQLLVPPR